MPTPAEVTKAILVLIPKYLADDDVAWLAKKARSRPDLYDINCGLCYVFAMDVIELFGGETDELDVVWLDEIIDNGPPHAVIRLKYGKHWLYFDAECPHGTNDPKRIPAFVNQGKSRAEVIKARRRRFQKIDQFVEKFFEYRC